MTHDASARERFAALAVQADDAVDLGLGALLIAAEAYPNLDIAVYLDKIEHLADAARPVLDEVGRAEEKPLALMSFLCGERGFVGNLDDYYDPRNSYLNEVLERRTGIPITLVVLYIEVARRLGLRVDGVGFPGHFLAKCRAGNTEIILDPFHGKRLTEIDCQDRLRSQFGPQARPLRDQLQSATKKAILTRMLGNLKHIHLRARSFEAALACCDRILLLAPDAALERRDRGLLYEQLECYGAAEADLENFLAVAPHDESAATIRQRLVVIRQQVTRIH